jgi:hypothetical protein
MIQRKNLIKSAAAIAWAVAAMSFATPKANAIALTSQGQFGGGNTTVYNYASCSAQYEYIGETVCFGFTVSYRQTIKFQSASCNQGGCASVTDVTYTDTVYPTGRKVAELQGMVTCAYGDFSLYGLGSCSC